MGGVPSHCRLILPPLPPLRQEHAGQQLWHRHPLVHQRDPEPQAAGRRVLNAVKCKRRAGGSLGNAVGSQAHLQERQTPGSQPGKAASPRGAGLGVGREKEQLAGARARGVSVLGRFPSVMNSAVKLFLICEIDLIFLFEQNPLFTFGGYCRPLPSAWPASASSSG